MFMNMNSEWDGVFSRQEQLLGVTSISLLGCQILKNNLFHTNFIECLFFYISVTVWYHVLLWKSFKIVFPQQGEELECDFGTEQRYEATWVNGSAVKCSGIMVS